MKEFYGYIRVSTVRQGEHGVSLEQQRAAIEAHARKNDLSISHWFEERETAAKRGRPVFNQMLKLLRSGKAAGVIIHKIDRSARNLKDWADLGELIDAGVVVHFANESLDLNSRGGRLSADIQAVVAADYIRNLREETRKGFYGRLKQGVYPRPAPLGYQDQGGGKPKVPHPIEAPLVRKAFELYSSGLYNIERLVSELHGLGLRTKAGKMVGASIMLRTLHNPFYTGLIRIRKTGETFDGAHEPIVPVALFSRVQETLTGKVNRRVKKFSFLFRQLFTCSNCGRCLIGELQKDHVYYRCHARGCTSRTVREEAVELEFVRQLRRLEYSQEEKDYFRAKLLYFKQNWKNQQETALMNLKLALSQTEQRLSRLTDAYLDQAIDRDTFQERKTALLEERRSVQDQIRDLTERSNEMSDQLSDMVELAGKAYLLYKFGLAEEKRDLVKKVSSNRTLNGKVLTIMLDLPFQLIANRFSESCGGPPQDIVRTWDALLPKLIASLPADPAFMTSFQKLAAD
jgi:DNA invertase Pin-like site-specific DNA recombinase